MANYDGSVRDLAAQITVVTNPRMREAYQLPRYGVEGFTFPLIAYVASGW